MNIERPDLNCVNTCVCFCNSVNWYLAQSAYISCLKRKKSHQMQITLILGHILDSSQPNGPVKTSNLLICIMQQAPRVIQQMELGNSSGWYCFFNFTKFFVFMCCDIIIFWFRLKYFCELFCHWTVKLMYFTMKCWSDKTNESMFPCHCFLTFYRQILKYGENNQ